MKKRENTMVLYLAIFVLLIILVFLFFVNKKSVFFSPLPPYTLTRTVSSLGNNEYEVTLTFSPGDKSFLIKDLIVNGQLIETFGFENISSQGSYEKIEGNEVKIVALSEFSTANFKYKISSLQQPKFKGTFSVPSVNYSGEIK